VVAPVQRSGTLVSPAPGTSGFSTDTTSALTVLSVTPADPNSTFMAPYIARTGLAPGN